MKEASDTSPSRRQVALGPHATKHLVLDLDQVARIEEIAIDKSGVPHVNLRSRLASAVPFLRQDEKVSTHCSTTGRDQVALKVFAGFGAYGSLDSEGRGGADDCHFPAGSRVVRISASKDAGRIVFRGALHFCCMGSAA